MSNYEEEKGTLVLPSNAVLPVRRALVEAMNKERAAILDLATRTHAYLRSDAGKPDRLALSKALKSKTFPGPSDVLHKVISKVSASRDLEDSQVDQVARLLLPYPPHPKPGEKPQPRKLQSPKKKDLPALPSQTWQFSGEECGVRIDPEKRTLHWSVSRNNHAVERAWEGSLGRALSKALGQVKWTRATGGAFNYSNEYAEDAGMDHGYNPVSISRSFGPLGEQEQSFRTGMPRRRASPQRR